MSSKIKVGAAQTAPVLGDLKANLQIHLEYIKQARAEGVDVLVFPELSLTGYDLKNSAPKLARGLDSEEVVRIAEASSGIVTIFGLVELGYAAQLHNSVAAVRDGQVLFLHRKLNLPNYGKLEEGKHFAAGRYLESFELSKPWHGSLLICADAWNPALVHLAALHGATLLCVPFNSAGKSVSYDKFSNPEGWSLVSQFYSFMYGMPLVLANRVGVENEFTYFGKSKIYGPFGELLAEAGGEEALIAAELDYQSVVKARATLPTVRDSNLDLIHREIERTRAAIGHPDLALLTDGDE